MTTTTKEHATQWSLPADLKWTTFGTLVVAIVFGAGYVFSPLFSYGKVIVAGALITTSAVFLAKCCRDGRAWWFFIYSVCTASAIGFFCFYTGLKEVNRLGFSPPFVTVLFVSSIMLLGWFGWRNERSLNRISLTVPSRKFDPTKGVYSVLQSVGDHDNLNSLRGKVGRYALGLSPLLITLAVYSDFHYGRTAPYLNQWLSAVGSLALSAFWSFLLGSACRQLIWVLKSERLLGKPIRLAEALKR